MRMDQYRMSNVNSPQREFVFPLLMLGEVIEKGAGRVVLPHRDGGGKTLATGKLRFGRNAGGITVRLKTGGDIPQQLKTGWKRLAAFRSARINSAIKKAADAGAIDLEILGDATFPCRLLTGTRNVLQLNKKFFALLSEQDTGLVALMLAFAAFSLSAVDERQAMRKALAAFGAMRKSERDEILASLAKDGIDFKGLLATAFRAAAGGQSPHELERLISILQVRRLVDIPYDTSKVDSTAVRFADDLAGLRAGMLSAIGQTYLPGVDADNAERVADWCGENGVRLLVARFGRAFYTDGLLIANGKTVAPADIKPHVEKLESSFKNLNVKVSSPQLAKFAGQLNLFGSEAQRIGNLMSLDQVPEAKMIGIIRTMRAELRDLENAVSRRADEVKSETIRSAAGLSGRQQAVAALDKDVKTIDAVISKLMEMINKFELAMGRAPKQCPVFVSFISRIHELDAINIARVNQVVDPFFGENEALDDVIAATGRNVYITPNQSAWLTKAHDWVEALPAFAHYNIVPDEVGSGYAVTSTTEREILEIIYKSSADSWAQNIAEVMAGENVALARELIIDGRVRRSADSSAEEKTRRTCIEKNLTEAVARLAAAIDAIAEDKAEAIGQIMADSGFKLNRYEALGRILDGQKKLVAMLGEKSLAGRMRRARAMKVSAGGVKKYLPLAYKKRRPLPNVHVLTTLGPTETEVNIANWLEEGMLLYNVCGAMGLDDKVAARVAENRRRVAVAAELVVKEQELEGELFRIIAENNMDAANPADRRRALFQLIGTYPEIAADVVNQAALQERYRTDGPIPAVRTYIKSNPALRKTARESVIANNGLSAEVRRRMKSGETFGRAYKKVAGDEYTPEEASVLNTLVRKELMRREKLDRKVDLGHYLRDRIGPLAVFTARREIVAEAGLTDELYNPNYIYSAAGANKRFNLMYTPSRVDLGPEIIESVRNVPKWVGGLGRDAASAGKSLYELFNYAGVTAVDSPRLAEFLKVGENFFTRGGVYYLSLTAGANIDTLGCGDFEFFQGQWNQRGDRMVLPTGETYGGFCVPKEFSLLFAIISRAIDPESSARIMDSFGVPRDEKLRRELSTDLAKVLSMRTDPENDPQWEAQASEYLLGRHEKYFGFLKGDAGYLSRFGALALALRKSGVLKAHDAGAGQADYNITNWKNKKAIGLEEINRSGVFDKVRLIYRLLAQARRSNENIAPDEELIGVMGAGYKEDVTDVRFSAGARKFEIYAGTAFEHLLEDIDPEGRRTYLESFRSWKSPRDVRIVGLCTAKDLFGHVPMNFKHIADEGYRILSEAGAGRMWIEENLAKRGVDLERWTWGDLPDADRNELIPRLRHKVIFMAFGNNLLQIVEGVRRMLAPYGFTEDIIRANAQTYGGAPAEWTIVKDLPKVRRQALLRAIGPAIHVLVLSYRDVISKAHYDEAVTGIDFIDLGIPDKELLDLVDNLPKLLHLMRQNRPDSALVFADGTSGGRRRTFSMRYPEAREKVKELFALDAGAVYGSHGLGEATVDSWRREMQVDRESARRVMAAVLEGRKTDARQAFDEMVAHLKRGARDDEALDAESKARRLGIWRPALRYVSQILGEVVRGRDLKEFDFAAWVVCGGRYLINGQETAEQIARLRTDYEEALASVTGVEKVSGILDADEADAVIEHLVRPKYVEPKAVFRQQETGVAGSLKATEELTLQLESRLVRRRQTAEAVALEKRRSGFREIDDEVAALTKASALEKIHALGESQVGDGSAEVPQDAFGRYLRCTKGAFLVLMRSCSADALEAGTKAEIEDDLDLVFRGGILLDSEYRALAGHIGRFFEASENSHDGIERCAKLAEMLDKCMVIDKAFGLYEPRDAWVNMATFLDLTINNHIFDYYPYHYHAERTSVFKDQSRWPRGAIFALARKRHLWLYRFVRMILETKTELVDRGRAYCTLWFGRVGDDGTVTRPAIGLEGITDPDELFWFSYARLRDTTVIIHDGYPLPQLFDSLDPDLMGGRANVGIIYPVGNTTVAVALEQNVKLMKDEGINVVLTPFPQLAGAPWHERLPAGRQGLARGQTEHGRDLAYRQADGHATLNEHTRIELPFAYFFMDEKSYKKALASSGGSKTALPVKSARTPNGVLVAARFKKPLTAHALWFHFTHYLRGVIHTAGVPLIQPLLWEAATYLKCALPEMLKGSGIACPAQANWFKKDTERLPRAEAMKKIRSKVTGLARYHDALILKAEKESGGRRSLILSTRDENGRRIDEHIDRLVEMAYDISRTDNVVLQEVVSSQVRRLYTEDFIEMLTDRFIQELGLGVTEATPLFSYFRTVISKRPGGQYDITHRITVVSTAGVANVGQGGRLFEYRDEKIRPRYRAELWEGIREASLKSIATQERYMRTHREYIIDNYLEIHQGLAGQRQSLLEPFTDAIGCPDSEIRYEMGDYMPLFLLDEADRIEKVYDPQSERIIPVYDRDGRPGGDVRLYLNGKEVELIDKRGVVRRIEYFDEKQRPRDVEFTYKDGPRRKAKSLVVVKVEPNPGAGLWRPHNDRLKLTGRDGEACYLVFRNLGRWAKIYRDKL